MRFLPLRCYRIVICWADSKFLPADIWSCVHLSWSVLEHRGGSGITEEGRGHSLPPDKLFIIICRFEIWRAFLFARIDIGSTRLFEGSFDVVVVGRQWGKIVEFTNGIAADVILAQPRCGGSATLTWPCGFRPATELSSSSFQTLKDKKRRLLLSFTFKWKCFYGRQVILFMKLQVP